MNQARIVAGSAKGRGLQVPDGVRPTSAMCRKVMLDALGDAVVGTEVLDLFAGAGVLSAEVLSRGADHVVAVERSPRIAAVWGRNLDRVGFGTEGDIMVTTARRAVRSLIERGRLFALIFADPPYGLPETADLWSDTPWASLLTPGGRLIIEQGVKDPRPEPAGLEVIWERRAGDTMIYMFRREDA
ncbi:RsmD family RNA methyltransferase [Candidatus Fermentibacteria bacterium]|nr:RsmD family RNA methyltransferase [Candidatus Fermentibacteria bacterium]